MLSAKVDVAFVAFVYGRDLVLNLSQEITIYIYKGFWLYTTAEVWNGIDAYLGSCEIFIRLKNPDEKVKISRYGNEYDNHTKRL